VFALVTLAAQVDLGWLPALSAPSMIVNWMSIPTAVGQIIGSIATLFGAPIGVFINIFRGIGIALLAWIAVRQWWAARDGGPDAIRRAGVVLLAVAVLSPATLPWYLSWGVALLAMAPWTMRGLQCLVFGSLMLVVVYYPNGEDGLNNWGYLAVCAGFSALAAVSLVRPDPLRLARGARDPRPATQQPAVPVIAEPSPAGADQRAR